MPLDGHSYLVSQGWAGHGAGLRQDSLIRPLAIPQKRTLSGLGKDRDEAFPFWDHLFSVAAKTIQVKLSKDDSDDDGSSDESDPSPTTTLLDRTSTGILSNKAPKQGTPASASASGSATPTLPTPVPSSSTNLLVTAKRETAKRTLYSRFFRGPILGPDSSDLAIDNEPGSSSSGAELSTKKPRIDSKTSEWDNPITSNLKNGGRTPMAIAKAKLVDAKDASIPTSFTIAAAAADRKTKSNDNKTNGKKRKRGEGESDEGNSEDKEKKKRKESEEERRARKEKEKAEKKERKRAEKMEKRKKGKADEKQVEDKKSKKRKYPSDSSTPVIPVSDPRKDSLDVDAHVPEAKKQRKEKVVEKTDKKKDKKRRKENEGEVTDEDERKRRKRERKEAKKIVLASESVSPKPGTNLDPANASPLNPGSTTPTTSEQDVPESKKKKKKRKSTAE